jgi:hypothetical protein
VSLAPRHAAARGFVAALAVASAGLGSARALADGSTRAAGARSTSTNLGAAPRNLEAEAASGDIGRMLAVVQDAVDCLRANGYRPGDPQVQGQSVVIAGWNPPLDSAAGRATEDCSFPDH